MRTLLQQRQEAIDLLGTIVATLTISSNRAKLATSEAGAALLDIADYWSRRYQAITGQPVGQIITVNGVANHMDMANLIEEGRQQ